MGRRGEGWVAIQVVIFAAILIAPKIWKEQFPFEVRLLGGILLGAGGLVATWGLFGLGRNLTPFPKPREGNELVQDGPYGLVRHPIYFGIIFGSLGWSLALASLPGVVLAIALFVFFDLKSRHEERWLEELHPEYGDYRKRVKKLIPWVY